MNSHDIIIRPVLSEKSFDGIASKRYTFIVLPQANKTEIKKAVEEVFGVRVAKVNTVNYEGKMKRRGATQGRRPGYKKAIVTLTADSKSIEYFESLN
jgi:large subunit ribosomal protein L23